MEVDGQSKKEENLYSKGTFSLCNRWWNCGLKENRNMQVKKIRAEWRCKGVGGQFDISWKVDAAWLFIVLYDLNNVCAEAGGGC